MRLREPKCDCDPDRLARRMAKLEEKLFSVMRRNAELEEENARLRAEVERLGKENARLQQQLAAARKDSSTSSKPPSSDIVKPKKPPAKGGKKRKKGGQPGHEQHLRSPFPLEAINHFEAHTLDRCPDCGGTLVLSRREPEVFQQVEITETPTVVTEHQGLAYWCPHCRKVHYAPMPEPVVKAGLFGPRLTALVAFMKGVCHASFSTIRKFLRDVVRVEVSRGYLAKLIGKVSEALAP
jgi:transposase